MKCLNCDNERAGRSKYCSGTCKTQYNRHKPTQAETDTSEPTQAVMTAKEICSRRAGYDDVRATLEHYNANPSMYFQRQEPARMNWGAWMTADELKQAGYKCNRVTIPGDWDYGMTA